LTREDAGINVKIYDRKSEKDKNGKNMENKVKQAHTAAKPAQTALNPASQVL
jgi:hypothetical protein